MAEVIEMPRLSDTMEEGVIAAWHKKVGDEVSSGDLLTEIETDKATMDFESPEDGVLLHIGVEEGKGIPVGSLLAIIGEKGEDISGIIASFSNGGANGSATKETAAVEVPVEAAAPSAPASPSPAATADSGMVKASPLAKAMAKDRGIDLATVTGTGDNGRIVKRDIESLQPAAKAARLLLLHPPQYRLPFPISPLREPLKR